MCYCNTKLYKSHRYFFPGILDISKLAPSERDDLYLSDNATLEYLWIECRYNFSKNCKSKILLKKTYNLLKKYQTDFLEQLMTNLDNHSWVYGLWVTITWITYLMGLQ